MKKSIDVFKTAEPASMGVNPKYLLDMLNVMEGSGLDGIVLLRDGKCILNAHFYPNDEEEPHVMYSTTKSIVSMLIGMAVEDGLLNIDDVVMNFFPEYPASEGHDKLTLKHVLTMSTGHEKDTIEEAYKGKDDEWLKPFFNTKFIAEPGIKFMYENMASHVLTSILDKVLESSVIEYAVKRLFGPLGITDYKWQTSPAAIPIGGWGLFLKPADMAKIGQMVLQYGIWNDEKIIGRAWLDESAKVHIQPDPDSPDEGYGYQWWTWQHGFYTAGMYGQYIYIMHKYNMTAVFTTTGKYDFGDLGAVCIEKYIIPAMENEITKEDENMQTALEYKTSQINKCDKKPVLISNAVKKFSGKEFIFDEDCPIDTVSIDIGETDGTLFMEGQFFDKKQEIKFGLDNVYRENAVCMESVDADYRCTARGEFIGSWVIEIELLFPGQSIVVCWQFQFTEETLKIKTIYGLGADMQELNCEGKVKAVK